MTVRRVSPDPVNAPARETMRINDDRTEENIDLDQNVSVISGGFD